MDNYVRCYLEFYEYDISTESSKQNYNYIKLIEDNFNLHNHKQYIILFKNPIIIDVYLDRYFDFCLYKKETLLYSYVPSSQFHLDISKLNMIYDVNNKSKIYGFYFDNSIINNNINTLLLFDFMNKYYEPNLNFNEGWYNFKLLDLPFVVQNNILNYLNLKYLLCFRLTSKKCNNIFKKFIVDCNPYIINHINGYYNISKSCYENTLLDMVDNIHTLIKKYNNNPIPKFLFSIHIYGINDIDDIEVIDKLYILKNKLIDISPHIYSLDIYCEKIMDINFYTDFLYKCKCLKYLHIYIDNITFDELYNLYYLEYIKNISITCIDNIKYNKFLYLSKNTLNNIKLLNINIYDLEDLIILSCVKNLEYLSINMEYIENSNVNINIFIFYLSYLSELKILNIIWNVYLPSGSLSKFKYLNKLILYNLNDDISNNLVELNYLKYIEIINDFDKNLLTDIGFHPITHKSEYIKII